MRYIKIILQNNYRGNRIIKRKTHFNLKAIRKRINKNIKFCIIFSFIYLFFSKKNIDKFSCFNNNSYYLIEEDNKNITWPKGIQYITKCLQGNIINRITNSSQFYKISIIIPVFNSNKTIIYSIRSIQNQNFIDFELILVNDFSNDNSKEIIESFAKNDSRIKIINNYKNRGTLYSRCIGVLSAKGKYIFSLDNDDMFFTNDLFYTIYQYQEKTNFDIIVFHSVFSNKYFPKLDDLVSGPYFHEHYLTLYQPELARFIQNDVLVWTKSIKTIIYQKAVEIMGKKRYSNYLSWAEDSSIMFIIFNVARSLRYLRKYGVFHIEAKFCASFSQGIDKIIFGEIFLSNIIFDFARKKDKKIVMHFISFIAKRREFGIHKEYLKNLLNKIIKSRYITLKNKEEIKRNFGELKLFY